MVNETPVALTIAGSDSGGGAGLQADLKTFQFLGVHGTSVVTAITAQNPNRILAIQACSTRIINAQLAAVFEEFPPASVKIGMLFHAEGVRAVARFFRHHRRVPLIIDPVMVASSGKRLLTRDAEDRLIRELFPLARLVTPNLHETEVLLGTNIRSVENLRRAARAVHDRFGCAALVKGGHLQSLHEAIDFFYDGRTELMLAAPFLRRMKTHGTGCTYSAAIAAYCAHGLSLPKAVEQAKNYISNAIAQHGKAYGHCLLNHQPAGGARLWASP